MKLLRIQAIKAKRNTSVKQPLNPVYPYQLRNVVIRYPNQAWCTDFTYIKLPGIGYVYLAAIMDIYSRKILSWRVSNTMDSRFCEEALKEAIKTHGVPAIFNTDQGSQFTSNTFTQILQDQGVLISMDCRGRWRDNIHIERLWRTVNWRTVKYEEIFIRGYEDIGTLRRGLRLYFRFYNDRRYHQNLDYQTPSECYESFKTQAFAA